MTNRMKKAFGGVVLALAAVWALAVPPAYAGNNMDVQTNWFGQLSQGAIKIGGNVPTTAVSTTSVIMNLQYTGTAASAYVSITGSSMTFYAPFGTQDTTIGGTSYGATGGVFDLSVSSVSTLGQLCDLINGTQGPFALNGNANGGAPSGGNWHCTLTGGVRSDIVAYLPTIGENTGVNNVQSAGGFDVPFGTNTIVSLGIIPATGRHVILNWCSVANAGTEGVQVFGVPAKTSGGLSLFGASLTDSNLVWQGAALSANTATNVPLATTIAAPWLEFAPIGGAAAAYKYAPQPGNGGVNVPVGTAYNGHVVVRLNHYATGSAAQTSSDFINCNWSER